VDEASQAGSDAEPNPSPDLQEEIDRLLSSIRSAQDAEGRFPAVVEVSAHDPVPPVNVPWHVSPAPSLTVTVISVVPC